MADVVETDELGPNPEESPTNRTPCRRSLHVLGLIQVLFGLVILAMETTILILYQGRKAPGFVIEYAGLWVGFFAIVTGVLQVLAGREAFKRKARALFLVGIGTTFVCVLQALVIFALSTANIYFVRHEIARQEALKEPQSPSVELPSVDELKDLAMLRSVVALIYLCLAVLALVSAILDCRSVRATRHGSYAPDQVVYASVDGKQLKQIKIYNKAQHIKS
jgi:uncharacterized membrane protein